MFQHFKHILKQKQHVTNVRTNVGTLSGATEAKPMTMLDAKHMFERKPGTAALGSARPSASWTSPCAARVGGKHCDTLRSTPPNSRSDCLHQSPAWTWQQCKSASCPHGQALPSKEEPNYSKEMPTTPQEFGEPCLLEFDLLTFGANPEPPRFAETSEAVETHSGDEVSISPDGTSEFTIIDS